MFTLLVLICKRSISVLDISALPICVWNILFLQCELLFKSKHKFVMKSNLAINSFVINVFCILSKKPLPTPNLCRFFSIFSSGRFIFLTFLSMDIYFEFLVRIIYKGQCSHYTCRYPIVPGAFVEKTIPSPLNYLGTFVGNQLAISVCTYL